MSDQRSTTGDQRAPPTTREQRAFYQIGDRRKGPIDRLLIALVVATFGCVKIPPPRLAAAPPVERWVDAYAPAEGDGGVMAALKVLPPRLSGVVHVRSGLYRGPFELDDGAVLIGHGEVVLFLEGEGTVATAGGRARLEQVSFQGGSIGLAVAGRAQVEKAHFSGQRTAALTVVDGGLSGAGLEVDSRSPGNVGIDAIDAQVLLDRVTFRGTMAHGVRSNRSVLTVSQLRSEGPANALQVVRGSLEATGLRIAGGAGPAISLGETTASLRDVETTGHEYGLLAAGGAVTVARFLSRGAVVAGLGFFRGTVSLSDVRVHRAGSGGGLQLLDATSTIHSASVDDAHGTGVLVRQGKATITRLEAHLIRGDPTSSGTLLAGDAVQVRDATVELGRLEASEVDGAALSATNFSKATATEIVIDGAATAGIVAERRSRVVATTVRAKAVRGAVLAAFEEGQLEVKRLEASDAETPAWADCLEGALIRIDSTDRSVEWQRCVRGPPSP